MTLQNTNLEKSCMNKCVFVDLGSEIGIITPNHPRFRSGPGRVKPGLQIGSDGGVGCSYDKRRPARVGGDLRTVRGGSQSRGGGALAPWEKV
eukprot:746878-Hanusia_phi.AAC.4